MKYILVIILIFWLLSAIVKFFVRGFFSQFNTQQAPKGRKKAKKQGEVHINKKPTRDKKIKEDVGEYVDYEEIN